MPLPNLNKPVIGPGQGLGGPAWQGGKAGGSAAAGVAAQGGDQMTPWMPGSTEKQWLGQVKSGMNPLGKGRAPGGGLEPGIVPPKGPWNPTGVDAGATVPGQGGRTRFSNPLGWGANGMNYYNED